MNKHVLHSLQCPLCHQPVRLVLRHLEEADVIIHGEAACGCCRYPILNGILLTVEGPVLHKIKKFVENYGWLLKRVRTIPFFVFGLPTTKLLASWSVIGLLPIIYLPFRGYVWFMKAWGIWQPEWAERILNPGKNEADQVADRELKAHATIIDIGCGTCDFEKRHQREITLKQSMGLDFDLFALYAAQRYGEVENLNLWWIDVNQIQWWFKKWPFDLGVCIDGFHYIREKETFLKKMKGAFC